MFKYVAEAGHGVGVAKEIITVKYFASNFFVATFFRVGDTSQYFRIRGNTVLKSQSLRTTGLSFSTLPPLLPMALPREGILKL